MKYNKLPWDDNPTDTELKLSFSLCDMDELNIRFIYSYPEKVVPLIQLKQLNLL